jgi:membrane protein implicated in regulation of membrane protease activity
MIGEIGVVRGDGMIFVAGELWRASCSSPLESGDQVRVLAVDNMRVIVEKIGGTK